MNILQLELIMDIPLIKRLRNNLGLKMENTKATARATNLRISPQKLNLVAKSIRGKGIKKAIDNLTFSRKRIAKDVLKVLNSAIANAENNYALDIDRLVVDEAYVGKAMVMKRLRARARGRAARILKPFSKLTITLKQTEEKK